MCHSRRLRAQLPRLLGAALLAGLLAGAAHAQSLATNDGEGVCGALTNAFGPFDYRPDHYRPEAGDQLTHAAKLKMVETHHFTPSIEALIRGNTSQRVGGDLDYTLRAFPNHHRALATLVRLADRSKGELAPEQLPRSIECYFNRATRFAPNDAIVRLLYASLLIRGGRIVEARSQIDYARVLAGNNGFTHYNVGMTYADAGDWDAALAQAHRAAELGFQRQGLRQRLEKAGKWAAPAAAATPGAAASAAAAAAASAPAESASRP